MYQKPEISVAKVDGKGRVLLPKSVRQRARLSEKTALVVVGCDNGVFLKEADISEMHIFEDIGGLALASLHPSGERVGVREVLISSLANQKEATCMKLYNVVRQLKAKVSYQAVWKMLQSLVEQQQVKRIGKNRYAINPEWIARLKRTYGMVEENLKALEIEEEVIACKKQ